ncbi:MAG: hypothetical protein HY873_01900 [Chloroflexi bacterium]|nr:hypothetical protein [Chloroflexota bacterium]
MAYPQSSYRPAVDHRPATADERSVAKWMLGFAAFVTLTVALGSLQMYQASSEGTAKESLQRATAALTEIDGLLQRHYDGMQEQAQASEPGDSVALEDYPIALGLTRDEVLGVSKDELRTLMLERSGNRLYEHGTGVLRESAKAKGSSGMFSIAGITDRVLGQLTDKNHARYGIATVALLIVASGLCAATIAACRGWGRLVAPGLVLAAAGAAVLVGGLAVMGYTGAQGGEYVRTEFFGVIEDLAGLPVRNGLACVVGGAVIVGLGAVGSTLSRRAAMALDYR